MTALRSVLTAPRAVAAVAAAGAAVLWPFVLPEHTHFYGVLTLCFALVALSLTVLAGWTAQISLCQAAFLGIGVYTTAPLLTGGVPFVLVVPIVAVVGAAISLVLGVPSLRLRGVYLTIVTLAFGAACEKWIFPLEAVSGGSAAKLVPRPDILGLGLDTDRALYLAGLVVTAAAFYAARNIRRSDVGRSLFAIRDSEEAAASLGIRIAPYKVAAFASSAALAAVAGSFYAVLVGATPAGSQFGILQSLFFLALPVIGGLELLTGALVGGMILATAQPVVNAFDVRLFLMSGVLLVAIVLARSGGIVGMLLGIAQTGRMALAAVQSPVDGVTGEQLAPPPPRASVRVSAPLPAGARVRLRLSGGGGS